MNRDLKKYNPTEHMGFTEHIALSREEVIDQIIDKDLVYYGTMGWLVKVLENGFAGYKTLSNHDLIEEYNNYYPDHCLTIVKPVEEEINMSRDLKKDYPTEHMDFTEHIALSREKIIYEIINKDLGYYGSIEYLEKVLKNGFAGYKTLSNHDLIEAFNNHYPDHCLTIVEPIEGGN